VETRVQEVLDAANVPWNNIDVTGPVSADPDRKVTVSMTSDFVIIPGEIMKTFNGTITLTASTTMRHESF